MSGPTWLRGYYRSARATRRKAAGIRRFKAPDAFLFKAKRGMPASISGGQDTHTTGDKP